MHNYKMMNYRLIFLNWIKFLGIVGVQLHGFQIVTWLAMVCTPMGETMIFTGIMLMAHHE